MAEVSGAFANPILDSLLAGAGDRTLRLFGARGILPLATDDRLRVLLAMRRDEDPEISREAAESIAGADPDAWAHFLDNARITPEELDTLAQASSDPVVLERIVRNRDTSDETMLQIAAAATGSVQEALVINQSRLLRDPRIIDALFENSDLTVDSHRRLRELQEEFFEKEARRRERDAAETVALPAAEPEPAGEPSPEAPPLEGPGVVDEPLPGETPEDLKKRKAAFQRIAYMTVAEKIQTALKGSREERRILITDVNKQVTESVLRCPTLSDTEVEAFAGMRSVEDDIFRKIGGSREWVRKYNVVIALVRNPKVPVDVSLNLVKFLRIKDLKSVAEDRNVPDAVRVSARKLYVVKRGGG
jgi:hypothetical protein